MLDISGLRVTTLRIKNKITGWDVNGRTFMRGSDTLLEAWKKAESFINKSLTKNEKATRVGPKKG